MNKFNEIYRPQYHFSAEKSWLNDPNGLVYYQGEYHLFYQNNPFEDHWGPMYWGHAVSNDMLHWKHLPVALEPDELGTIFSGCCVVDKDDVSGLFDGGSGLIAFYTAHKDVFEKHPIETQCLAYSKDKGRTWIKYENNPIILPPDTPDAFDFRDPKVIYDEENKRFIMALGGGFYRFYKSTDLIHWDLMCETKLFEEYPDISWLEVENEPNKKELLICQAGFRYFLGHFENDELVIDQSVLSADYSEGCQAAQTYFNIEDGRTIWIAWLRDGSRGPTSPWRCSMSIPKEIKLRKMADGTIRLIQKPIKELETLEEEIYKIADKEVTNNVNILENVKGKQLDIECEINDLSNVNIIDLNFFKSSNGRHGNLRFDLKNHLAFIDYTGVLDPKYEDFQTSFPDYTCPQKIKVRGYCYNAPLKLDGKLKFRVLLDRSSVEVFVENSDVEFTCCCYPCEDGESLELLIDGNCKIDNLSVKKVNSVWEE